MGRKFGMCLSTVGLAIATVATWYLMKGPFLGAGLPPVEGIMTGVIVFVTGLLLLRSVLNAVIHESESNDRVIISNKKV